MSNLCGFDEPPVELPDTGGTCCYGATVEGPHRCTCWTPVYGPDQADPAPDLDPQPATRPTLCGDCAYRPGSPEKAGDPGYRGDAEELESLADTGERFFCHQGMRAIVKWVHPSGAEIQADAGAFAPPMFGSVPLKTDGTPADLCGGWAARRRAILGAEQAEALRIDALASLTATREV